MTLKRHARAVDHRSMPTRVASLSDERGYTLVELMVAAVVLIVGVMGAFTLIDGANRTSVSNNARMGATNLAREILEDARSIDYDLLTDADFVTAVQAKPGMSGSGSPWKVLRRGIEFTVATTVCTFDDPKDNVAAMPPADVCTPQAPVPASAVNLAPETQPDDFRRVTVKLTWNTGAGELSMNQTSLINNPTGGLGPRIITFEAPNNPSQLGPGEVKATFPTVTTTAASVRWNSDGGPNGSGDATGGPTTWTTEWQLGTAAAPADPAPSGAIPAQYEATTVLDGTYTVSAQAFDDLGIAGDSRVAVLPLNRSVPLTVTGFEAGRNSQQNTVEFQWEPNPERDIIGYQVYNAGPDDALGNGDDSLVCATADVNATSCVDPSPPAGAPTYYVVALDKQDITDSSSAVRRSPKAKLVSVPSSTGVAPPPPLLMSPIAIDDETGNPELSWTHPDPDGVRFYRIYRDTCDPGPPVVCGVEDRYDATPSNGTTWTDLNPGATTHRYWVTAVDPTFNESPPSNSADSALLP